MGLEQRERVVSGQRYHSGRRACSLVMWRCRGAHLCTGWGRQQTEQGEWHRHPEESTMERLSLLRDGERDGERGGKDERSNGGKEGRRKRRREMAIDVERALH